MLLFICIGFSVCLIAVALFSEKGEPFALIAFWASAFFLISWMATRLTVIAIGAEEASKSFLPPFPFEFLVIDNETKDENEEKFRRLRALQAVGADKGAADKKYDVDQIFKPVPQNDTPALKYPLADVALGFELVKKKQPKVQQNAAAKEKGGGGGGGGGNPLLAALKGKKDPKPAQASPTPQTPQTPQQQQQQLAQQAQQPNAVEALKNGGRKGVKGGRNLHIGKGKGGEGYGVKLDGTPAAKPGRKPGGAKDKKKKKKAAAGGGGKKKVSKKPRRKRRSSD